MVLRAAVTLVFGYGVSLSFPGAWLVFVLVALILLLQGSRHRPTSHGSGRLATLAEVRKGGLLQNQGLILGRADLLGSRAKQLLLRTNSAVHLATFSPTGGGKGAGVIIPNLLRMRESVVITDIKDGENFKLTAAWRSQTLGHRIYRFDPFGCCGPGGDTINPLDFIDATAMDFLDQCRDLAKVLVVRQGTEPEPHFNDRAENVIYAMIAFTCATAAPEHRNLESVRLLVSSPERFSRAQLAMENLPSHHNSLAVAAESLRWLQERERASVLSTISRHLDFLASPAVYKSLASTNFDPRILKDPACPASFYFCMPVKRAESLPGLYRLIIDTTLRVLTNGDATENQKVYFFLDEAALMGDLPAIRQAVTLMRGKGVRLWFFFQSHQQVEECYGKHAATILDNLGTRQYFHLSSLETAKYLSERLGDTTITVEQRQDGTSETRPQHGQLDRGQGGSLTRSTSVTRSEIARRVRFPDEILTLPEYTMLIVHKNMHIIPATLLRYYADAEFRDYWQQQKAPSPALTDGRRWSAMLHLPPCVTGFLRTRYRAALVLGMLLMAVVMAGKLTPTPAVGTQPMELKPATKPQRPAQVRNRVSGYARDTFTSARPNAAETLARRPLSYPPLVRPAPASRPASRPSFVPAEVAGPHMCGSWCPNPLRCPQLNELIRSTLSQRRMTDGR